MAQRKRFKVRACGASERRPGSVQRRAVSTQASAQAADAATTAGAAIRARSAGGDGRWTAATREKKSAVLRVPERFRRKRRARGGAARRTTAVIASGAAAARGDFDVYTAPSPSTSETSGTCLCSAVKMSGALWRALAPTRPPPKRASKADASVRSVDASVSSSRGDARRRRDAECAFSVPLTG